VRPVARWNTVFAVVAGSYRSDESAVQDEVRVVTLPGPRGPALALALSDGAGSARFGQDGARIAVATAIAAVRRRLSDAKKAKKREGLAAALDGRAWHAILGRIRRAVHARAAQEACDPRELAATLLVAVADADATVCAQVGDGAIVFREGESYRAVFWPDQGEFVNTTRFVMEDDPGMRWAACGPVAGIAAFSDGLQGMALDYAARSAFGPFFAGLFAELERHHGAELQQPLRDFLRSEPVRSRSDDDLALVLALRK
jgi:hypothetical protein